MINLDYILLDAARLCSHINTAWDLNPRFDSLYRGASRSNLATVAPYLFTFPPNTPFSQWYAEYGFGDHWGVLFTSNASFEECHKHFRKFLKVKTASGKELYFRFYDPRVLKIFLPSCTAPQLIEFFGPITAFIVEGNTATECIIFSHNDGALQQQNMAATDLFLAK
jgi:hypothetical protein